MSDSGSSLGASFLGAFEGAISVLLTLFVGYYTARIGLLDHATIRRMSKLCSSLFLPCLIVVQMGPELTASNLRRLWIIPFWGLASTIIAHLLGWLGQTLFKTRAWVIIAAGRPNTSALPLLLLQSLESTGVLDQLADKGQDSSKVLERAKSLILLNVVLQQTITFQTAPWLLLRDKEKDRKENEGDEENGPATLIPQGRHAAHVNPIIQDTERVGLLQDQDVRSYGTQEIQHEYPMALKPIIDEPDIHWPRKLAVLEKPLKSAWNATSPPLIGAVIALILGLIPQLNYAFFDKGSALYSSLTQSIKDLGDLFVALQMFIVGGELATVSNTKPGLIPTTYALIVRFLVMPALSLVFVWATAGRGWYTDDKLVWFLLILIPAGPSAMLLANVSELVNVDQGPIAGYLTISYFFSPVMAVVTSLGLLVVENVSKRVF